MNSLRFIFFPLIWFINLTSISQCKKKCKQNFVSSRVMFCKRDGIVHFRAEGKKIEDKMIVVKSFVLIIQAE